MFMVMLRKTTLNCFQSVANIKLQAVLNMYYCIYHNFTNKIMHKILKWDKIKATSL